MQPEKETIAGFSYFHLQIRKYISIYLKFNAFDTPEIEKHRKKWFIRSK